MAKPTIALAPADAPEWIAAAILEGGGELVEPSRAEGVVWFGPYQPGELGGVLNEATSARWVQLPWAGIEPYLELIADLPDLTWTCGKGVYAEPVAEHALALAQAGLRGLPERVKASSWGRQGGRSLFDGRVSILGGGGITQALIALLEPLRCEVTVVRRSVEPMAGAARVLPTAQLGDALTGADVVVVALALTSETTGIIAARQLAMMEKHAWLVNVARGAHVVTDDLVAALRSRIIGGAALDVTEPEPLPDGHPLWGLSNCIITPHTANTAEMAKPHVAHRVRENVRRFANGEELIGLVDVAAGY